MKSEDNVQFTSPLWHRYPVHLGDFAIEKDRTSCTLVIQKALSQYISELRQAKRKRVAYRLYLALFEAMTGLASKRRSVNDFMEEFSFSQPIERCAGLGPVACAALTGDRDLVRNLVNAKACLQTHAPAMPEVMYAPDYTPLHLALWFRPHDLQVAETLLELQADPCASTINLCPPLGYCRSARAVDLLIRHRAGVNFQGKTLTQACPIHNVTSYGAPCEVVSRLIELQADVHGGRGGNAALSPLHTIASGLIWDVFERSMWSHPLQNPFEPHRLNYPKP